MPDPISPIPDLEFRLLADAAPDSEQERKRQIALAVSVVGHVLFFLALPDVVSLAPARRVREIPTAAQLRERSTPLVAPPRQVLTQREPNRRTPDKEIDLEGLVAPQNTAPREQARAVERPAPRPMKIPNAGTGETAKPRPAPIIQAQEVGPVQAALPEAGNALSGLSAPPPPPASAKPKMTFESVGANTGSSRGTGAIQGVKIETPKGTVDEAVRAVSRSSGRSGPQVVGDMGEIGSASSLPTAPQAPGSTRSALELLSDPQGVDFRPYLIQVLAAVRRNWFAVIPESAKLGRPGRVAVQFAIAKNGGVPKLVIASGSGTDSFDRAAVAGISASNPFPPLPAEYKGEQIRLQLVFHYNAQRTDGTFSVR